MKSTPFPTPLAALVSMPTQRAMERVIQAGAVPVTWEAVMAELGRLFKGDYIGSFVGIMSEHLPNSV